MSAADHAETRFSLEPEYVPTFVAPPQEAEHIPVPNGTAHPISPLEATERNREEAASASGAFPASSKSYPSFHKRKHSTTRSVASTMMTPFSLMEGIPS